MATRAREALPGKEKRGISPTFPRHNDTVQRKSPNPSPARPGSTDKKHDSASSEKHIPNYLKPTISSTGLDHHSVHHHVKKPGSSASDATHKPTLARRRSFDRPPPAQAPKSHISPNPKERNLRSSTSFSSKSTTIASQKTLLDRLSKAPKDAGKKQGLYARPVSLKKSSSETKKQVIESSSETTNAPITGSSSSVDNPDIADIPQPQEEDPQSIVTNEEDTINAESNYEMPAEIVHVEDKEHIDPQQAEPETKVHEEINITESSAVVANQDASDSVKMEEPEDQNSLAEETNSNHLESGQHVANKSSTDSANESLVGEPKAEDQEKVAEEDATGEALDKNEEATNGSQVVNTKDSEEVENTAKEVKQEADKNTAKEVKQEADNVAAKRPLPVQAKKESSVSNDVIEETASKLREQRKNKVKALAGAFETVISLQEHKP